jgi:hypothetical protein
MTGSKVNFDLDQFLDLERSFALGNKAALYDAISRSTTLGVPLPAWAACALEELVVDRWAGRLNTWSGYKALLARFIRSEVYRACMLWVQNKHHYKRMPTRCIQAWYDYKFEKLPAEQEQAAMTVALEGLQGTPAAKTSWEYMESQRYFDAIPEAEKLQIDDIEDVAASYGITPDEYRALISASYRDHAKIPLSFGFSDTEVLFGLRPEGQFWGPPPGALPEHIQAILDAEPIPWSPPPASEEK